jgi:hypothetical protein
MTVAELHEDYGEALARYAFRLVRDDDQADDLVQETFIRILGHLATARTAQALSAPRLALPDAQAPLPGPPAASLREEVLTQRFALQVETSVAADDSAGYNPFDLVPAADRDIVEKRYRLGLSSR